MRSSNHLKARPQIRSTYGLRDSSAQCLVKGKYFDTWTNRQIKISLQDNTLDIITLQTQKKKSFVLDQITYTKDQSGQLIRLKVSHHRIYDIRNNQNLQQLLKDIDIYKYFKHIGELGEQSRSPRPQKTNYFLAVKNHNLQTQESTLSVSDRKLKHSPSQYKRCPSYYKTQDWRKDKNGGLLLINKQKKRIISQMITYTARKAVKSGSFFNVNLPAFGLKPETVLQTYCRCLGAAPIILSKIAKDPLSRIKAFNTIVLTMSIMFNDIQKAFNPAIGQTFQGQIAGNAVYAEQISRKPNLTSFLFVNEQQQYRIYGNLELNAVISLNEAVGVFNGEVTLQFKDGGMVIGAMPKGTMSGVLFGDTKFGPSGAVYSYDPHNQIVCSYEVIKRDVMRGYIGKLRQSSNGKFQAFLDSKKYNNFKALQEKDFAHIYSKIEAIWTDHISYDGIYYFNYNDKNSLPIEMTQNLNNLSEKETLLLSDSSFRKDVKLRKLNSMKESQKENDMVELQEERKENLRQMGRNSQKNFSY